MEITRFEDVEAWKGARELVKEVYRATDGVLHVDAALVRQMRRAAVSVPSNTAEGFDAGTDLEFKRFLRMARRSLSELQSHLYIAVDLEFLPEKAFRPLYDQLAEVKRILGGFLKYLGKGRRDVP